MTLLANSWACGDLVRRVVAVLVRSGLMIDSPVGPSLSPAVGCVSLMCVQPQSWPEPAPEIVAAVRAVYRRREVPLPVSVRDRLGEVFPDAEFAPAFGVRAGRGGHRGGWRWSRCFRWWRT